MDPTLIIQFPLVPSGVKNLFPKASGLVTVFQNPVANDFDTVTVDVQNMPPNNKFTVFFTELSAKPFGHAEYVGDVITRGDGSGESVFHLITFVAFAADNRNPGTSQDQSGTASGIQLEHVGIWFDGLAAARAVLHNPTLAGTPNHEDWNRMLGLSSFRKGHRDSEGLTPVRPMAATSKTAKSRARSVALRSS